MKRLVCLVLTAMMLLAVLPQRAMAQGPMETVSWMQSQGYRWVSVGGSPHCCWGVWHGQTFVAVYNDARERQDIGPSIVVRSLENGANVGLGVLGGEKAFIAHISAPHAALGALVAFGIGAAVTKLLHHDNAPPVPVPFPSVPQGITQGPPIPMVPQGGVQEVPGSPMLSQKQNQSQPPTTESQSSSEEWMWDTDLGGDKYFPAGTRIISHDPGVGDRFLIYDQCGKGEIAVQNDTEAAIRLVKDSDGDVAPWMLSPHSRGCYSYEEAARFSPMKLSVSQAGVIGSKFVMNQLLVCTEADKWGVMHLRNSCSVPIK